MPYQAPVTAAGGLAPYTLGVSGLPAGLGLDDADIVGTPTVAGSFAVNVTATDSTSASAAKALTLAVVAGGNNTVLDESKGKTTPVGPNYSYLIVGTRRLIWDASTKIVVNTPNGERHVIDGFVTVGMKVQWKPARPGDEHRAHQPDRDQLRPAGTTGAAPTLVGSASARSPPSSPGRQGRRRSPPRTTPRPRGPAGARAPPCLRPR